MQATIKKYKSGWLVSDNNGGWVGFADHDEAVKYAYDMGATDFSIYYSSRVMRAFTRVGVENFILKAEV